MQVSRGVVLASFAAFVGAPLRALSVTQDLPHVHGLNGAKLPLDKPIDLHIRVLDGPDFRLVSQRGKVVVMNFFASWCPPCREEAADFVTFAQTHAADTFVVGIDYREIDDTVRAWRKKYAVPYPLAIDERGGFFSNIGLHVFPSTLIFRPDGTLSCVIPGSLSVAGLDEERRYALEAGASRDGAG